MFRFVPPLAGAMDIGHLRLALYHHILATQTDDKLLVRIQDTAQYQGSQEQDMLDILALFGIVYHDIIYQNHNLKFHQQLATKLLMDKHAFTCFCTPDILKAAQEKAQAQKRHDHYDGACENLSDESVLNNENPFTVRVKRPQQDIPLQDTLHGNMSIKKEEIDSFVILHEDKTPTHNFATAVDDLLSDIALVIQEKDQRINSAKQSMIRDYLGYDKKITYAHFPHIVDVKHETIPVTYLLEEGYLPSAISNYLIMIGYDTPDDIFDVQDAIAWFDLTKVSDAPVTFDLDALRHINREHIKKMPALELAKFIGYSSKDLGELAKIYTQEGSTINDIKPKIDALFTAKVPSTYVEEFQTLVKIAKDAPFFKAFDDFKAYLQEKSQLEGEKFLTPLRVMLTGADKGPELGDIYPHIKNYLGEIIQ